MIPTVFAAAFTIFPRSRMDLITPMIGLVATLAPTIGPTVGGYLTDALSWHWLFLINVVPGIVVTIAALALIDFDKPDYSLFDNFDWVGPARHGRLPRRARIRAGGGPAQRLVRRRHGADARLGRRASPRSSFFARVLTARAADRRPPRLRRPQFRDRIAVLLRARHRPLRADLSLSALSGADPRLQCADDRRDACSSRASPCS